jgi:hypothetical protein
MFAICCDVAGRKMKDQILDFFQGMKEDLIYGLSLPAL